VVFIKARVFKLLKQLTLRSSQSTDAQRDPNSRYADDCSESLV
jgi:hypothetical protein